jgi:hypothetical protein
MKLIIRDLDNNIVDTINCNRPISKSIEEAKKKYPPGKYTGELTCY